jgi:hypothetical protein
MSTQIEARPKVIAAARCRAALKMPMKARLVLAACGGITTQGSPILMGGIGVAGRTTSSTWSRSSRLAQGLREVHRGCIGVHGWRVVPATPVGCLSISDTRKEAAGVPAQSFPAPVNPAAEGFCLGGVVRTGTWLSAGSAPQLTPLQVHIADSAPAVSVMQRRLRRSVAMWRCRQERTAKPSAQPTLVRTQHLPPPAKTACWLRKRDPAGRFVLVTPCVRVCHCGSMRGSGYGHITDSVWAERAVRKTVGSAGRQSLAGDGGPGCRSFCSGWTWNWHCPAVYL